LCTAKNDDVGGRRPGIGGHRDSIAWAHSQTQQSQMQRGRSVRDRYRVFCPHVFRDRLLELCDSRTLYEVTGPQNFADRFQVVLFNRRNRQANQYVAPTATCACLQNSPVRRIPSSRSIFASKPIVSRAFTTEGTRSSTST